MKAKAKPANANPEKDRFICLCNSIKQSSIENAIARGCDSVDRIGDATTAGFGPCGGSCRPILQKMLDAFQQTGKFLEQPMHPKLGRKR